jgi:hypothetical protein
MVLLALLAVVPACGDSNPNGPSDNNNNTTSSLSATIDGAQWTANAGVSATYQNNILSIGGSNSGGQTTLGFAVGRGDGGALTATTYTFAPLEGHNATLYVVSGGTTQGWFGGPAFGSGTITIAALSSTGASGTFVFTLVPTPGTGSSGNKSITQGVFNVRF